MGSYFKVVLMYKPAVLWWCYRGGVILAPLPREIH